MSDNAVIVCVKQSTPLTPVEGSIGDHCSKCDVPVWLAPQSQIGETMPGMKDGKAVLAVVPDDAVIQCSQCTYTQAVEEGDEVAAYTLRMIAKAVGEIIV